MSELRQASVHGAVLSHRSRTEVRHGMGRNLCLECANAGTPICSVCTVIMKPGGEESEPSMFCPIDGEFRECAETAEVGLQIYRRVIAGKTVPLRWVIRLNGLLAGRK